VPVNLHSTPASSESQASGLLGVARRWFLEDELRESRDRALDDSTRAQLELARRLLDAAELILEYPRLSDAALALFRDTAELLSIQREELGPLSAGLSPGEVAALVPAERQARLHALRVALGSRMAELEAAAYRRERLVALRRSRMVVAALVSLSALLALLFALGLIGPAPNLALGKPVTPSTTYAAETYPPEQLVDGNADDLGFHTELEDQPSVTIDLQAPQAIHRVVVVNRPSYRERALPLVIETSADGRSYREFARRDRVFEKWSASAPTVMARYVRLRVENETYFHLNEVSVY
jgi:hypothetical protein